MIPNPSDWKVTPETGDRPAAPALAAPPFQQHPALLLPGGGVETAIWLTEVAPQLGKEARQFLDHLDAANEAANPGISRLALKLATGAGKTTVMAMIIAWQTVNAVRHPGSKRFTRGFLVVTPGITIKDRLRVLQPNDPDSYFTTRELIPNDMYGDIKKARIIITNFHAFKLRETLELSSVARREPADFAG
jgi:type III restriction enzyme